MIKYKELNKVKKLEFIELLNKQSIRKHLINHPNFNRKMFDKWLDEKIAMNNISGCKLRAIYSNDTLAGWCGIQYENKKYEIAIILDDKFWGIGKTIIFKKLINWAKELGHQTICINFFHTRKKYKFLEKIALNKYETTLFGEKFITYELDLN